ncbi:MAG: hypothetical protein ACE5OZ_22460 [Candidatus Heimdallarchaeota archaeon]
MVQESIPQEKRNRGRRSKLSAIIEAIDPISGTAVDEVCKKANVDVSTVNRHLRNQKRNLIEKRNGKLFLTKSLSQELLRVFYSQDEFFKSLQWFEEISKAHEGQYDLFCKELEDLEEKDSLVVSRNDDDELIIWKTAQGASLFVNEASCGKCFRPFKDGSAVLFTCQQVNTFSLYHPDCFEVEFQEGEVDRISNFVSAWRRKVSRVRVHQSLCPVCLNLLDVRNALDPDVFISLILSKLEPYQREALYQFLVSYEEIQKNSMEYIDYERYGEYIQCLIDSEDLLEFHSGTPEFKIRWIMERYDLESLSEILKEGNRNNKFLLAWHEFYQRRDEFLAIKLIEAGKELNLVLYDDSVYWLPLIRENGTFYHRKCWEIAKQEVGLG